MYLSCRRLIEEAGIVSVRALRPLTYDGKVYLSSKACDVSFIEENEAKEIIDNCWRSTSSKAIAHRHAIFASTWGVNLNREVRQSNLERYLVINNLCHVYPPFSEASPPPQPKGFWVPSWEAPERRRSLPLACENLRENWMSGWLARLVKVC